MVAVFTDGDDKPMKTIESTSTEHNIVNLLKVYNSNYPKDPKSGVSACFDDTTVTSGKHCLAHYNVDKDDYHLPLSRFKISTRLEKQTNVEEGGMARTDYTGDGKIDGRFEKFAGAG